MAGYDLTRLDPEILETIGRFDAHGEIRPEDKSIPQERQMTLDEYREQVFRRLIQEEEESIEDATEDVALCWMSLESSYKGSIVPGLAVVGIIANLY